MQMRICVGGGVSASIPEFAAGKIPRQLSAVQQISFDWSSHADTERAKLLPVDSSDKPASLLP